MANTNDLKKYWQDLAAKAGLSPEDTETVSKALGQDSVAKAFKDGFIPIPDYHRNLDQVKQEVTSERQRLEEWHQRTALPAYQTNLAGIEELRRYKEAYGDLVDGPANYDNGNGNGAGLTQAQLDRYFAEKRRELDRDVVGLTKTVARMTMDHLTRFKEPLDIDAVEKLAVEKGLPPDLAYEKFIEPRVQAQKDAEFKAQLEARYNEGLKDGRTKAASSPNDPRTKEYNVFFDRTEDPKISDLDADRKSQAAFLEGWNNWQEEANSKN